MMAVLPSDSLAAYGVIHDEKRLAGVLRLPALTKFTKFNWDLINLHIIAMNEYRSKIIGVVGLREIERSAGTTTRLPWRTPLWHALHCWPEVVA